MWDAITCKHWEMERDVKSGHSIDGGDVDTEPGLKIKRKKTRRARRDTVACIPSYPVSGCLF